VAPIRRLATSRGRASATWPGAADLYAPSGPARGLHVWWWDRPWRREVMVDPGEIVIVLTTVGADVNAGALASALVEERLAACVNVLPEMTSHFRWRGVVEQAEERQLLIKTTRAQLPALEQRLHEVHPYEVPEFLVVPVESATDAYYKWILASTGADDSGEEIKH
jgi:periplasmic divalent cation tolerance protein